MPDVTYGRVFSFAVKDGRALNEDYLTEHLALALRLDPRPFVRAFSAKVSFPTGEFDVRTQVLLADGSRLDLVLERAGKPFAWVEIKAGAGEHGDQLQRYEAAAAQLNPPPSLLLLGPATFWPNSQLPRIVWSDLVEAVAATEGASHIWHFVAGAIEHFGLGGGKRMPLTDVEIASPQTVNVAIERLKTFVFELKQELSAPTRRNKWWGNHDVDWLLWDQLKRHQRLIYQFDPIKWDTRVGDPPMYLWLGIENDAFVMGVEARYNLAEPDLAHALGSSVLKALAIAGWSQGPNNNELRIGHENTAGVGESDLLTWAVGRISEVESSGAFEKMRAACTKERVG
jgi:hypothetical protein